MADNIMPKPPADTSKAEGEPWSPEGTTPDSDNITGVANRDEDGDNAGGISNRPIDEEVENQDALPERGHRKNTERGPDNDDAQGSRNTGEIDR